MRFEEEDIRIDDARGVSLQVLITAAEFLLGPTGEHIFCISDNGPGIAEADLPQIFAPFRRLPHHRNKPGSGLGLYFVKTFVEDQGGRVWVESRVGEGTQFYIALPAEGAV